MGDINDFNGGDDSYVPLRIELNRSDLRRDKINTHIDDITVCDFKSSSITLDDIRKAELITYVVGARLISLKNKYEVWKD